MLAAGLEILEKKEGNSWLDSTQCDLVYGRVARDLGCTVPDLLARWGSITRAAAAKP